MTTDSDAASASSAARSIRFTAAISTSADAAQRALELTRAVRDPVERPAAPAAAAAPRRSTGSRWSRSPSPDRRGWRASDLELRARRAVVHVAHARAVPRARLPPSELFFIIGADAFAEIATWRDYPAILDAAHFAVVSRPGFAGRGAAAAAAGAGGAHGAPAGRRVAAHDPSIILIDAPTADVSSTAIRQRLRRRRVDRRAGAAARPATH